jgi:uncharacterized protein (DUF849 family)
MNSQLLEAAKAILSTVAPTLATALGGPMAGVAVTSIIKALDIKEDSTEEEVLKAISTASPESLLKLKEMEHDFKAKMKQLEVDVMALEIKDKENSRKREIETSDKTNRILAYLIVALYIAMQLWLVSGNILPQEMREIVMRALGTLDAIMGMVFSYYFGSSLGSKEKTYQIENMINDR